MQFSFLCSLFMVGRSSGFCFQSLIMILCPHKHWFVLLFKIYVLWLVNFPLTLTFLLPQLFPLSHHQSLCFFYEKLCYFKLYYYLPGQGIIQIQMKYKHTYVYIHISVHANLNIQSKRKFHYGTNICIIYLNKV
jgi:hypothetical protein